MPTVSCARVHIGGMGGRKETGNRSYRHTVQQAASIWKVIVKCVVDSSSVVSVRGLERNVGCCKRRGGNGSL